MMFYISSVSIGDFTIVHDAIQFAAVRHATRLRLSPLPRYAYPVCLLHRAQTLRNHEDRADTADLRHVLLNGDLRIIVQRARGLTLTSHA
jgi:hypothetical protein